MVHVVLRDPPPEAHARGVRSNDAADDLVFKAIAGDLRVSGVVRDEPLGRSRSSAFALPPLGRRAKKTYMIYEEGQQSAYFRGGWNVGTHLVHEETQRDCGNGVVPCVAGRQRSEEGGGARTGDAHLDVALR